MFDPLSRRLTCCTFLHQILIEMERLRHVPLLKLSGSLGFCSPATAHLSLVVLVIFFRFIFISPSPGLAVPSAAPLIDAAKYRPGLQRPFSFTHGVVPEAAFSQALGAQLGIFFYFILLILCMILLMSPV